MSGGPEIVMAGDLFVDLIMSGIEGWPEPGKEVFASHYHREIGGGAMITACGLAKLGIPTAVLGVAGRDAADWITSRLVNHGVDTSMIQLDGEETNAFTVIATSPHDRAFLTYLGASRRFPDLLMESAKSKRFSGIRHVHLACAPDFSCVAELFERIRGRGCTISLDVGWREDWLSHSDAHDLLKNVDIFFPNEREASRLTGETNRVGILKNLADRGIRRVALKLGSAGAALLWDGQIFFADPYPVKPVDTTGAGDSFNAGFLFAWLRGCDPRQCLRTATVCGAISTQAFGGIDGFPTLEHLEAEFARESKCEN